MCNGWEERMAVLQLAVSDSVYLLDMLALPHCVPHSELRAFTRDVFSNPSTLKLGILHLFYCNGVGSLILPICSTRC